MRPKVTHARYETAAVGMLLGEAPPRSVLLEGRWELNSFNGEMGRIVRPSGDRTFAGNVRRAVEVQDGVLPGRKLSAELHGEGVPGEVVHQKADGARLNVLVDTGGLRSWQRAAGSGLLPGEA